MWTADETSWGVQSLQPCETRSSATSSATFADSGLGVLAAPPSAVVPSTAVSVCQLASKLHGFSKACY